MKNRLILYYNVISTIMNKSRQLSIHIPDDSRQAVNLTTRKCVPAPSHPFGGLPFFYGMFRLPESRPQILLNAAPLFCIDWLNVNIAA